MISAGGICYPHHGGRGRLGVQGAANLTGRGFIANAVDFDGTNDYLDGQPISGIADGKLGMCSFWFNMDTGTGTNRDFFNSQGIRVRIRIATGNSLIVLCRDSTPSAIVNHATQYTSFGNATGWHHFMSSWDTGNNEFHLYIDDFNEGPTPSLTDANVDYNLPTEYSIGASDTGANKIDGEMAEFWFDTSYINLDLEINRRKFITHRRKPADLGSDGSTPTGSQPLVYLANGTSTWQNNLGSGGNFTEQGALGTAGSSPSDTT